MKGLKISVPNEWMNLMFCNCKAYFVFHWKLTCTETESGASGKLTPQSMRVSPAGASQISEVLGHPPPQSWNPCCTRVATILVNAMSTKMELISHFNYGCSLLLCSSQMSVSCLLLPWVSAFWLWEPGASHSCLLSSVNGPYSNFLLIFIVCPVFFTRLFRFLKASDWGHLSLHSRLIKSSLSPFSRLHFRWDGF